MMIFILRTVITSLSVYNSHIFDNSGLFAEIWIVSAKRVLLRTIDDFSLDQFEAKNFRKQIEHSL